MGTLIIDLVTVEGGAIKLSSAEFGTLLELPPFWLTIRTGQPCEVQIPGMSSEMPLGYAYAEPSSGHEEMFSPVDLIMAMMITSALERRVRQEVHRRMMIRFLLFETLQIGIVVLMVVLGIFFKVPALIIFFVGMYLSTWMSRGWFRTLWILATIGWALITIIF